MKKRELNKKDEKELLYRSLRGEKEAWGETVRRYKDAVYGINLSILRDEAEAEDATQETFIKAWY
ncbi:RNA polymerase subunit sigma-70, partial [Candidatus Bipolaricaulota bacterium]|nr:RNA polymerase subunit sigma-70 [Candidatus Bipolaricaulota bacterium]